jgi:hypothetical protein
MISEIPWIAVIGGFVVVLSLFIIFKSFNMPSSFKANQQKREELLRKKAMEANKAEKPNKVGRH